MDVTSTFSWVFVSTQLAYLCTFVVLGYFLTRRTNWVDPDDAEAVPEDEYPEIILLYPVLHEDEATMRTTFLGLAKLEYPTDRFSIVAIPNEDDTETIASLIRLKGDFSFLEILTVPPTRDASWQVVWDAWDLNPKAYWWNEGRGELHRHHAHRPRRRDLPPKKTRQLVYAFYTLVAAIGDKFLLNYIDADSVPPPDHFKAAVAGMRHYDVLQSTNVAGNLLDTWASSWHSFDHMSWDGFIYPHMSANGQHPFWVLGKGLFFKAYDLVEVGGFNPWLTIEDPDVGMRMWVNGKRLGVIANPLIEEVPLTLADGITQRKRWVAGFFQSLSKPLKQMGMSPWQRFKARLNVVPCLSLMVNVIGLPIGVWALADAVSGINALPEFMVWIGGLNVVLYLLVLARLYHNAWRRSAIVQNQFRERLHYLVRVNPLALWAYWLIWTIPIVIGFNMFLRDRGQAWERTNKNDANHDLVRARQATLRPSQLDLHGNRVA